MCTCNDDECATLATRFDELEKEQHKQLAFSMFYVTISLLLLFGGTYAFVREILAVVPRLWLMGVGAVGFGAGLGANREARKFSSDMSILVEMETVADRMTVICDSCPHHKNDETCSF